MTTRRTFSGSRRMRRGSTVRGAVSLVFRRLRSFGVLCQRFADLLRTHADPAYRIKWSTAPPRKTPPHDNLQLTVTLWTGMKLGQKRQWYLPTGDTEAESQEFEDWAQTFEQFIKTKPLPSFEEVAEQVEQQAPFDVNSREQYYNYFESIGWGKSTDPFDYGESSHLSWSCSESTRN